MERFDHETMESFRGLLGSRLGLRFDDSRMDLLGDVLRDRVEARGRMPSASYLASLSSGGGRDELRTLASLLTVTETYFFRSSEHLRVLADVAVPQRLRALKGSRPLRILSAGCASGEEPFSVAILLREQFPDLGDVRILGIDVNPAMLARAAAGRYGSWALRELPMELRERYFSQHGRDYLLDAGIRRMAAFQERNLGIENGMPWDLELFDIVFCRNTIMYMVPEAARLTVARLTRTLVPGGFLFLSHAETLRGLSRDFHLCHTHEAFYYQKREAGHSEPPPPPRIEAAPRNDAADLAWADSIRLASQRIESLSRGDGAGPSVLAAPAGARRAPAPLGQALDLLRQERFREALEVMRELSPESAADRDALLLRAVLLVNCGEMTEAQALCRQLLSSDDLNASAQYLTALCREHSGDYTGAVEHDRAAIYLDSTFAMPHLHLGLLAKRSGDLAGAKTEIEHAAALLEYEEASRILLLGGGFSRQTLLEFSRAQLAACGGHP